MFELVQNNPILILINIIMLAIMWFTMRPAIIYTDEQVSSRQLYFVLFMWFVFNICSFWGSDWFHLYTAYDDIMKGDPIVEKIYTWIANKLAPDNYFLFRIIVWGTAQLLLWDTFRRLSVSSHLLLALFVSIWMIWFSYGRVSLAMAIAFWGLTIYHKTSNISIIPKIIGVCAILISFYLHKSAVFLIIVSLLTILTKRTSKTLFVIGLIGFPLLAYLLREGLTDTIILTMTDRTEDLNEYLAKAQQYMNAEETGYGIGPLLAHILEKVPYYLIMAVGVKAIFDERKNTSNVNFLEVSEEIQNEYSGELENYNDEAIKQNAPIPENVKVFIRALFFIVLFSSAFLFSNSVSTQVIYNRFLKFSFIPATVVLGFLLENPRYVNYAYNIYRFALFGTCYQMIYMLYCSISNSK